MANKFWVGSSGSWSDSTNHWALTSGGIPAPLLVPTSSDDVFIDANSGFGSGGTITMDVDGNCNNFTCTSGHSYTITGTGTVFSKQINFYGSVTLESGLTFASPSDSLFFTFVSIALDETITTNGAEMLYSTFNGTGKWTLQDDLTIVDVGGSGGEFYQENGTFDANDHNVTANDFYFYADTGYTPTVNMGSGTWEATGSDWNIEEANGQVVTINAETSTIKLTGVGATFMGTSGKIYNNLWLSSSSANIDQASNTFNNLKIDAGTSVSFMAGFTQTISSLTAIGTLGNLITLNSDDVTQFTLSKTSGVVSCDYLDISNSNAGGGATWYAGSHSADTTNNDGWIFTDEPVPVTGQFMAVGKYW